MADNLIAPLTPADCDLRDFAYMPLDVVRLRDSGVVDIEAEAFRATVLSWCVAWHQVPAGSLPDDDTTICRLLGYGRDLKGWLKLRAAGALRNYVKCSDGRLYHTVVAEKARESWQKKLAQRDRTEAARTARLSQNKKPSVTDNVTGNATDDTRQNVTGSKGREYKLREGKIREGKKDSGSLRSPERAREKPMTLEAERDQFFAVFPRKKEGPGACLSAFKKARNKASFEEIMAGLERYEFDPDFLPQATTWLNQSRWLTQPDTPPPSTASRRSKTGNHAADLAVDLDLDLLTPVEEQFKTKEPAHADNGSPQNGHALGYEAGPPDGWWESAASEADHRPVRDHTRR